MLEVEAVKKRCAICQWAVLVTVTHLDLDENGEKRVWMSDENVPHSSYDCKRAQALMKEEWPPF